MREKKIQFQDQIEQFFISQGISEAVFWKLNFIYTHTHKSIQVACAIIEVLYTNLRSGLRMSLVSLASSDGPLLPSSCHLVRDWGEPGHQREADIPPLDLYSRWIGGGERGKGAKETEKRKEERS